MDLLSSYQGTDSSASEPDSDDETSTGQRVAGKFEGPVECHSTTEFSVASSTNDEELCRRQASNENDFFALDQSSSDNSDAEDQDRADSQSTQEKEPRPTSSTASFWNSSASEVVSWDKPEKIWGCQTNNDAQQCAPSHSNSQPTELGKRTFRGGMIQPFKKRQKVHVSGNKPTPQRMSGRGFYVHHKVAPFLHQTVVNKCPKGPLSKTQEHRGTVSSLAWCSQTEYSHLLASSSLDRTIKIWNAFSKDGISCVQTLTAHDKGVRSVQWVEGGKKLISASFDRTARLFDVESGAELSCFRHPTYVSAVCVHPVSENYFLTGSKNSIQCWDVRSTEKSMRSFVYKDAFGQVRPRCQFFNDTNLHETLCGDVRIIPVNCS